MPPRTSNHGAPRYIMVLAASRSILESGGESVNEGNTPRARLESPESGPIPDRSGVDLSERPCRQLHGIEGHASSARVNDIEKRRTVAAEP